MDQQERNALRDSLRDARRNLTADEQSAAASSLNSLITDQEFFKKARKVAFYLAVDGEINPLPLLESALKAGKECFLPVVDHEDQQSMHFAPFTVDTGLIENQWGMLEPPLPDEEISATNFDIVFVPLVGFDENCFRLGMGKGFYDRTFSFKIFNRRSQPLLVGLAHECQLTEPFRTESWDVRLDAVITAEKIYRPDTA